MHSLKRVLSFLMATIIILTTFISSGFSALAAESQTDFYNKFNGLPTAYINKLWELKQQHPNWQFEPMNTGLDWDTVINTEAQPKANTVWLSTSTAVTRLYADRSVGTYTASRGLDYTYEVRDQGSGGYYVDASVMAIAAFMNPYYFLDSDVTVLMFENLGWGDLDYNTTVNNIEAMLTGTFMSKSNINTNYVSASGCVTYVNTSGQRVSTGDTYAALICTAAKNNKLNPYYLTSKILGEVGTNGSGSTSGTTSSYTGYYNYLNVGASDSSSGDAVANGLSYAKSHGWTSPGAAIEGGAQTIANGYISAGQDTPYLQKFNVANGKITTSHQYMTAINGIHVTLQKTYDGYKTAGTLDSVRTFKIPVYKNMPNATGSTISFSGYPQTGTVKRSIATIRTDRNYSAAKTTLSSDNVTLEAGLHNNGNVTQTGTMYYGPLWYKVGNAYVIEDYVEVNANATVKKGGTLQLNTSQNSGSTEKPRFMSWDKRIATVNANGVVTGVSQGTTKVVAYLANGSFAVVNVTVSTTTPTGVPTTITSSNYSVNNTASFISKIPLGTTAGTLKSGLNEKQYVSITKGGRTLGDNEIVTTGCVVSIVSNGSTIKSYTTIVTGDVGENNGLGDGAIDIADLIAIRNEILASLKGKSTLSGANYKAADVDGNGSIEIDDLIKVRDQILKRSTISPRAY
ncbi:MAG: Ig-like domain-containing protein [Oscillospiraceae bacterium]|nr:Ig-like domain-containing protein [Candidatus Limimonas egerieequi]